MFYVQLLIIRQQLLVYIMNLSLISNCENSILKGQWEDPWYSEMGESFCIRADSAPRGDHHWVLHPWVFPRHISRWPRRITGAMAGGWSRAAPQRWIGPPTLDQNTKVSSIQQYQYQSKRLSKDPVSTPRLVISFFWGPLLLLTNKIKIKNI